jgi:transposase
LIQHARDELNVDVEVVSAPPETHTFQVLPRRWVVERTYGWWNRERRLSKDYERLPDTTQAFVYVTMIRLMTRRLARPEPEPPDPIIDMPDGPVAPAPP